MPCAYKPYALDGIRNDETPHSNWLAAIWVIVDAFREALAMRRAAHRRHHLGDE